MKKRTMISTVIAFISISTMGVQASEMDGKQLFEKNCISCHALTMPTDKASMVAPLGKAVVFHLGEAFGTKEAMKKHINDFVLEPTAEKAICRSVRRFGLMPSLKGVVSKEELAKIADWMVENLSMTKAEHTGMQNANRASGMQRRSAVIFDRIDTNRDGVISKDEFAVAMGERVKNRGQGKDAGNCGGNCGGDCNKR